MPSWGQILQELTSLPLQPVPNVSKFDYVRRKYLGIMHALEGRAVIVYATRWALPNTGQPIPPSMLTIAINDMQGFMEALDNVTETQLDLLLHSPGGSAEAAEAIVKYLRVKFEHIRVFVPHMAMSAATMIACAADEIVMGAHSFIGPIDPQLQMQTSLGVRSVPAQALVEQFEKATIECQDPAKMRAWLPMLSQYGPDLLVTCQNLSALSRDLVSSWLAQYMLKGRRHKQVKADAIANWLSDHGTFKTHGRPISRDQARAKGMKITYLETDQALQDAVLSVHHATAHTFTNTPLAKLIENHAGKAYMEQAVTQQFVQIPMPFPLPPGAPLPSTP